MKNPESGCCDPEISKYSSTLSALGEWFTSLGQFAFTPVETVHLYEIDQKDAQRIQRVLRRIMFTDGNIACYVPWSLVQMIHDNPQTSLDSITEKITITTGGYDPGVDYDMNSYRIVPGATRRQPAQVVARQAGQQTIKPIVNKSAPRSPRHRQHRRPAQEVQMCDLPEWTKFNLAGLGNYLHAWMVFFGLK